MKKRKLDDFRLQSMPDLSQRTLDGSPEESEFSNLEWFQHHLEDRFLWTIYNIEYVQRVVRVQKRD